uniref:Putative secreted protein n=1 Tax=Anopheles marajoara TaxID=58244 RepID=A0A2M4CAT9_9DIPT
MRFGLMVLVGCSWSWSHCHDAGRRETLVLRAESSSCWRWKDIMSGSHSALVANLGLSLSLYRSIESVQLPDAKAKNPSAFSFQP